MRRKGRRVISLVGAFFMLQALSLGAMAFQNEPDGFRGLKWGDPPGENMEYIGDFNGNGYEVPDDKMKIGDVNLRRIVYHFYENRFYLVAVHFVFLNNYDLLKIICEERYGMKTVDRYYNLRWISQEVFVTLSYKPGKSAKGLLVLGNTMIDYKRSEDKRKEEAEKAEGDW